jgi:hypothetical protein
MYMYSTHKPTKEIHKSTMREWERKEKKKTSPTDKNKAQEIRDLRNSAMTMYVRHLTVLGQRRGVDACPTSSAFLGIFVHGLPLPGAIPKASLV